MMRYATFRKATRITLKAFALIMALLLVLALIIGIAYLRGGIRGIMRLPLISSLIGIDHQVDLGTEPLTQKEIEDLDTLFGTEVGNIRPGIPTGQGEVALSAGQFAYLLDQGGLDPEMFDGVQVRMDEKGGRTVLSISMVTDAASVAVASGYSAADLNALIGELPETVAVLAEIVMPDSAGDGIAIKLDALRIGQIGLSDTLVDSANEYLGPTLETFFMNQYGLSLDDLAIAGQSILIQGDLPVPVT